MIKGEIKIGNNNKERKNLFIRYLYRKATLATRKRKIDRRKEREEEGDSEKESERISKKILQVQAYTYYFRV